MANPLLQVRTQLAVWLCVFGLLVGVTGFAAVKQPEPPKSAALLVQQSDIDTLKLYEEQVANVRSELANQASFTDSRLRHYRRQLETVYVDLESRSIKYKQRIKSARGLMLEFSISKADSDANKDNRLKVDYDPYYLKKIREFKQEVAFYEGRLLQIRLLEFEIKAVFRNITKLRNEVNHSGVFSKSATIYRTETWDRGAAQFKKYTSKLWLDMRSVVHQTELNQQWAGISFVLLVSVVILLVYFYWLLRWLRTIANDQKREDGPMQRCLPWLVDVVCRGWLPGLFVVGLFKLLFGWYQIDTLPLLLNCLRSLSHAIGFIFISSAMVYASCRYFQYNGRSLLPDLKAPLLLFVSFFTVLLFINNINIYSVTGRAYPFYPTDAVDLLNFVLSLLIVFSLIWLSRRMFRIIKG